VRLSETLNVSETWVSRFLRDGARDSRTPNRESALRMNRAIADLTGHPPVEGYLDFVAAACGLLQEERFGDEALDKAATWCLQWYGQFFEPGGVERVRVIMREFDEPARRKLVLSLNRALRSIIIEELLPAEHPVGFTTVLEVLKKSGINTRGIVSEQSAKALAWERFEWIVRHELAEANPSAPASERLAAARRIFEALTEHALAAVKVSPDGASGGALREVTTMELGQQVGRFDGDHRAAWLPFMPPTQTFITKFNTATSVRRRR
jgi:hypothetical protein